MIVLHLCEPKRNSFRVYRFDLKFVQDRDIFGNGSQREFAVLNSAHGKIRGKLKDREIGRNDTDRDDWETPLRDMMRPLLLLRLKRGYKVAVSAERLAKWFAPELETAERVEPTALACAYDYMLKKKETAYLQQKQMEYLRHLESQGQGILGILALPERPSKNPPRKSPPLHSRRYTTFIEDLGQESFDF